MNRHDFFWLALKLTGLYLMAQGVLHLPHSLTEGERIDYLLTYIPMSAGALFLAIRVSGGAEGAAPPPSHAMHRGSWFWLVCKTLGLWWTMSGIASIPFSVEIVIADSGSWYTKLVPAIYVVLGLVLLLTDALPNLVATRAGISKPKDQ